MVASSDSLAVLEPVIQENKLIIPEKTEGLTLAHYLPVLQQYREINKALVFDYRTKKGNAEARSHVAKLRRVKAPIEEIHKRLKAKYLAITTKMDAEKKDTLSIVEEMIEHHDKELRAVVAEEAAEAQRKKDEQHLIDGWDLAHEMNAMFDKQRELDQQAAEQAKIAEQQAAQQREIEQQRREKEIADKAAEDTRKLAEAEADRKAREAENARKAEEERKRQEEEQARADLENIKRVHWLIVPAMVAQGIPEEQAKALILAIRDGGIPAVSIDYQFGLEA